MKLIFSKIKEPGNKWKAPVLVPRMFAGGVWGVVCVILLLSFHSFAQGDARAGARIDARQIAVGDQARLFIEVQNDPASGHLQWAVIPDSFNKLEVVEKGKIDTIKQGRMVTYRQRLLITGFDSGLFTIPAFTFSIMPNNGAPYTVQTDSFPLLVQTMAVDTTKGFKGIKGIIYVKSTWLDYIWLIIGGIVFVVLIIFVVLFFARNRKTASKPQGPVETLQDYTLRLLNTLEARQLWQKKQVKEYYVELTDIIRNYIEARFQTTVMELTTDELLAKTLLVKELQPYHDLLARILHTADLAKFAKFQPLPQEHTDAMEQAKKFVDDTRPVILIEPTVNEGTTAPVTEKQNPTG